MIFGTTTLAHVHVVLSLIAILSGLVVVFGLLGSKRLDSWTAVFLFTTVLTSVTGFLFPFHKFLPSHGVGIISLAVLAVAIPARYVFHLAGGWRRTYVITATAALYRFRLGGAVIHEGANRISPKSRTCNRQSVDS